jgi:hypothetical protein
MRLRWGCHKWNYFRIGVKMPEWCMTVANALLNKWAIGNSSQFCDEPADWDSAEVEEIAEEIWRAYKIELDREEKA